MESNLNILVNLQTVGEYLHPVSLELISKARELTLGDVDGVIISDNPEKYYDLCNNMGISKVYGYKAKEFKVFIPHIFAQPLVELINQNAYNIVLMGSTLEGRILAPVAATKCKTGLTADCTGLDIKDGLLIQTRPAFGGDKIADIITPKHVPQMATVRPGVFKKAEPVYNIKTDYITVSFEPNNISQIVPSKEDTFSDKKAGIEDAGIVFAVGRGVSQEKDLEFFVELSKKFGATLGYSRGIVEKGWVTNENQIGFSGRSISPKVLVTFGVSGSVQFLAGIQKAEYIIAINNNKNEPIFRVAHKGFVGNLYDIARAMM